jgi:hypothetical protein
MENTCYTNTLPLEYMSNKFILVMYQVDNIKLGINLHHDIGFNTDYLKLIPCCLFLFKISNVVL